MNAFIETATQHHQSYAAYLVRLWQDTPDGPWRASAQSVQSGEVVRFGSLQDLFAFFVTECWSSESGEQGIANTEDSEINGTQAVFDGFSAPAPVTGKT